MPIRITGLNSGLDTEALISELVSAYSTKKDKYVKAQTKLSWKQNIWKSLNSKVKTFYSSLDSLRFSNGYSLKTSTISDSTKATVSAGGSATNGVQSLQITQLAKSGYLTGGKLSDDKSVTTSTKLSALGYSGTGTITVGSGDKSTDVSVTGDTTIAEFVNSLKDAGVNASFDETNQRLFVSAKDTGKDNDFTLVGSDSNGSDALLKLGLKVKSTSGTAEYAALANYAVSSFSENADGTYNATAATTDSDGNIIYDATATQNYVKYLLKNAAQTEEDNEDLTAANEILKGQLSYLTNYESSQTVLDNLSDTDETKLKSLLNGDVYTYTDESGNQSHYYLTPVGLSGTYTAIDEDGNDAGTVVKDADGNVTVAGKSVTAMDNDTRTAKKKELEIAAGLYSKNESGDAVLDADGNKTYDATTAAAFEQAYTASYVYEMNDTLSSDQRAVISDIKAAHTAGTASVQAKADELSSQYNNNTSALTANNEFLDVISNIYTRGTDLSTDDKLNAAVQNITSKVSNAVTNLNTDDADQEYSAGATRVDGQDSKIYLNGAEFTSSSNTITVNDLTITATGVTGSTFDSTGQSAITVTTATDTQGLYDKIKDFLTSYNDIINEMTKLYNADSAKAYEPLTNDEKSQMTDKQVEQWEEKIKDSLLRRDSTLSGIMSVMENAMATSFEGSDGKNYSFSSFGIQTLGYLNADKNEQNAYHIYGDSDDTSTSSYADKLMAALQNDPDTVVDFMKNVTTGLHDGLAKKMSATSLRSSQTIYNDKEMAQEYSDYTDTIKQWTDKVSDMEDYYYKKFAAMESALSTLQSSSSALSSLLS